MNLILKNLYSINNGGVKMKTKRTLLDDFLKIYHSIPCDIIYKSCIECKNENLCKALYKVLLSIRKFY